MFGWVLIGKVDDDNYFSLKSFCSTIVSSLHTIVKQFWALEELLLVHIKSDEIQCEKIFSSIIIVLVMVII